MTVHNFLKIALIALALGAGFFAGDIYQWHSNNASRLSLDNYCALSTQPCHSGDAVITLDRDTGQPLIPTQISVDWPSATADSLLLTLKGYEMNMGSAVFKLVAQQDGQFTGEIMLPVCTLESMTWYGELTDGKNKLLVSLRMDK